MPMSAYEPDLDVGLWDHIFYGYPLSHSCNETYLSNNANFYGENYLINEFDPCLDVENDEVIAHTLQEELSQLAGAGYSESSCASEDNMLASVLTQDWLCSSRTYSSSGNDYSDEVDGINPCCSCSSPKEKHYDREEQSGTLEFADDVSLIEGEMGRRLSNMASVPHVPKVNGEIPSQDEAMSDHQRLLDRLLMYDLVELKVQGDGNCQFRALSDQIYRISEHHKFVRQQVINQLKYHPEIYEGYVPMAYDVYIKKMSKSGEWGDHVTLQAAADWYGVKIFVMTSFKDTCYVEILPYVQKSKRVIFLSFWAEVHYNSIYPEGELPTKETKKRRWWCRTFGYRH